MNTRALIYACLAICGLLTGRTAFSQRTQAGGIPFRTPGNDSLKVVQILNAKTYHSETKDSATQLTFLVGDVRIKQENTYIDCDSMILNPKENYIESFGHVHIKDNDSTDIYSDYMKYEVDKKTVHFLKSVKMTDGKGVLTTDELQYDLNQKVGTYDHGGKIVNKGSVLTSESGIYFEGTKDVYFKKNVVLRDPQYDLSADSLKYNTSTQVSTFITETFILFKDSTHRTVRTKEGYYDLQNRKAFFGRRPIITDGSQKLIGDNVDINDSTGISTAIGNAVYVDTTEGFVIKAGSMINDKKKKVFLATERPLMILRQDKDSIYIRADTLFSARLIDKPVIPKKVEEMDSLHRQYEDSLFKASSDSLHRVFTNSAGARDTLGVSSPDSTHSMIVKLSGDSLIRKKARFSTRSILDTAQIDREIDSIVRSLPPMVIRDFYKNKPPHPAGKQPLKRPYGNQPQPLPGLTDSTALAAIPAQPIKPPEPDKDHSTFADTAKAPITDSSLRYILAYHHVQIFSDSLQAVADSMYYSGRDSIFRLFYNPIAWGNGDYQITGDTMYVYTKNKKANRLYVFENALAINKVGKEFYNQVKGTTINAYFKDGQVDYMRAKGNAESIYYVQDDNKAYTGANKAHADIIDMVFAQKADTTGRELRKVILRNDVEGSMIPFKKINFDDMRLRGFKWQDARRPKSKEDLLRQVTLPKDLTPAF